MVAVLGEPVNSGDLAGDLSLRVVPDVQVEVLDRFHGRFHAAPGTWNEVTRGVVVRCC